VNERVITNKPLALQTEHPLLNGNVRDCDTRVLVCVWSLIAVVAAYI